MSIYSPIRDAFADINKLMIDKERWDAEHAYRAEDQQMRRMQFDSAMEDRKRRRIIEDVQIKEAQSALKPTKVNVYDYAPNREVALKWLEDPEFKSNFARAFDGADLDLATGFVVDADKKPIELAGMDVGRRGAGVFGLIENKMDPLEMINVNQIHLKSNIASVEEQLKGMQGTRMASQRAPLEQQLSKLRIAYNDHEKMKTPERLLESYRGKLQHQQGLLNKAIANGAQEPLLAHHRMGLQMTAQQISHLETQIGQDKRHKDTIRLQEAQLAQTREQAREANADRDESRKLTERQVIVAEKHQDLEKEKFELSKTQPDPKALKERNDMDKEILSNLLKNPRWFGGGEFGAILKNMPDTDDRYDLARAVLANSNKTHPELGRAAREDYVAGKTSEIMEIYWNNKWKVYNIALQNGKSDQEIKAALQIIDNDFKEDFGFVPPEDTWQKILKKKLKGSIE